MKHEEQIQYLPLEAIQRDADQVRTEFDPEALQRMTESLKEVGLLVPIRVRLVDGRYVIVDGEQRLRAAKLAGFATIAAIVEGPSSSITWARCSSARSHSWASSSAWNSLR